MSKQRIEALAEAIIHYSGYLDPGSVLYDARNPGGLKARLIFQARDDKGNRTFSSMVDGFQALVYDLNFKMAGKSKAKLTPENTIADLAAAYFLPATTATAWCKWLKKALHSETITVRTPLSFFQED